MPRKRNADPLARPRPKKPRQDGGTDSLPDDPLWDSDVPERVRLRYQFSGGASRLDICLPPIHNLDDIFTSITNHAMQSGFQEVIDHMASKPLRVATACSGTESPLLALEMVQRCLKQKFDVTFEFDHLFSAEIVPFKQAYIERNFKPPLLFRDVSQLKHNVAQTAYGSLRKVPKDVDLLVAGFSCVDFSVLNNKKKTLDDLGESGETLMALIEYAESCRPRMVILENVLGCPWHAIAERWERMDYLSVHLSVDTKDYYIPHTRCRGYMFCIDRRRLANHTGLEEKILGQWTSTLQSFKRRASSPAGMFLLSPDDRRLEQIEADMATRIAPSSSRTYGWVEYAKRHVRYRNENKLGHRRPVSKSEAHYKCHMPDFFWHAWANSMVERVWDTLDINFLRRLQTGHDMNFKERFIDLSQGMDRDKDARAYGIIGCVTPNGIPFITSRGGPLCGREALALQGLPLDRLLLTRERERDLQDLAGNAMSSTVVGPAILSALITGHKVFDREHSSTAPRKSPMQIVPLDRGDLVGNDTQVGQVFDVNLEELKAQGAQCAMYCNCERHSRVKQTILICTECGHTACSDCSRNPPHEFMRATAIQRSPPLDFIGKLKNILPTRLVLTGISVSHYNIFKSDSTLECDETTWRTFLKSAMQVVGDELRFRDTKRSEFWTVVYSGKFSVLKLVIHATAVNWLLFAKPSESEPVKSLSRMILDKPIARMTPLPESILAGEWEICAPLSSTRQMTVHGTGTRIASYEQRCGLETPEHKDSEVWSELAVNGSLEDVDELDIDIRGTYKSLPNCGMANATLHKKEASAGNPAVYLFLDPAKYGAPEGDMFVFSLEHWRITGYESRLTIAQVSHKWRASDAGDEPKPVNIYHWRWSKVETAVLEAFGVDSPIECRTLNPAAHITIGDVGCHHANVPVASFSAPASVIELPWQRGPWRVIDPVLESPLEANFSWMVQRAAGFSDFREWRKVDDLEPLSAEVKAPCAVCAPRKPGTLWASVNGRIRAYENPHDASQYERLMKSKPPAFRVFHRIDESDIGRLLITLNIQALMHRAYDKLLGRRVDSNASFSWRLVPNAYIAKPLWQTPTLIGNHGGHQAQPSHFRIELRPEQKRSLSWMKSQEDEDVPDFEEEETEEAFLPLMTWRAEGRVSVQRKIRGGVLADEVGYGKTAITLALISTKSDDDKQTWHTGDLIPSAATLIIVPESLITQWCDEIKKFTDFKRTDVLALSPGTLAQKEVGDIQKARIILAPLNMFAIDQYCKGMRKFTGMPDVPLSAGRNFDHWFKDAQAHLMDHVRILMDKGPEVMLAEINRKHQEISANNKRFTYEPSRRYRGEAFMKAKTRKSGKSAAGTEGSKSSDADASAANATDTDVPDADASAAGIKHLNGEMSETDESESDGAEKLEARLARLHPELATRQPQGSEKEIQSKGDYPNWNLRKDFNIRDGNKTQGFGNIKIPVLHAFSFNRLVIDEFTYADKDRLDPFFALQARSKWILSGTPAHSDFTDINTIARFLGVHLGIDNDELHPVRRRSTYELGVEKFQAFREPQTGAWHMNRHGVAQRFLNRFARQNVAEIDEIPCTEHVVLIGHLPAESCIYLELHKALMAQDGWVSLTKQVCKEYSKKGASKRGASTDSSEESNDGEPSSDRLRRQKEILDISDSPMEALVKRAAVLVLENGWANKQPEVITLDSSIALRRNKADEIRTLLEAEIEKVAAPQSIRGPGGKVLSWFMGEVAGNNFGNQTLCKHAFNFTKQVLNQHNCTWEELSDGSGVIKDPQGESASVGNESTPGAEETESEPTAETRLEESPQNRRPEPLQEPESANIMSDARAGKLMAMWVRQAGELKFAESVSQVQLGEVPKCESCEQQPETLDSLNILDTCGHILCVECVVEAGDKGTCAVEGCGAVANGGNIINGCEIGRCHVGSGENSAADDDGRTKYGGSKMDKLVEIIRGTPEDDKVLLFIQFPDLADLAMKALELAGIPHRRVTPPKKTISRKGESYQNELREHKVLILILGTEQSSGLNLQHANQVIFLSPVLSATQYDYESSMCQAIGRSRRFGQMKPVHVYHLLASRTIDVSIYQERRGKVLIERDGRAILVAREEASADELASHQAPAFNENTSIGW